MIEVPSMSFNINQKLNVGCMAAGMCMQDKSLVSDVLCMSWLTFSVDEV